MIRYFRHLCWFLSLYFSSTLLANGQFVTCNFQFESEIVDIIEVNKQYFLATAGNGLYVSEDGGQSWLQRWLPREIDSQAWDGFRSLSISSIAYLNNRLWAMTNSGMYASDDLGISWREIKNPFENRNPAYPTQRSTYHKMISHGGILFVTEQFISPNYGYRLLKSVDNGDNWLLSNSPDATSLQLVASGQTLLLSTRSDSGAAVFASKDYGQTWNSISKDVPFQFVTSVAVQGSAILITGNRSIKDQQGSYSSITMLATSLNSGQNWQLKELSNGYAQPPAARASIIQNNRFYVAITNQLAYSNGDGQWKFDSLGIQSPNSIPEGGMAIIRDTLWVGYQNKRLQSDQFALKGYLLSRPISEFDPDYIAAPSLLRADNQYRETIILDWQRTNSLNGQYYYSLERAEETPTNFQSIAQLSTASSSYIDENVKHGKQYYYRLRTELRSSSLKSKYSPIVGVAKADLCIRQASLNYFEDLQMPSVDTLFARCGSEIVRSVDGGKSWGLINPCYFFYKRYSPSYGKYSSLSFPSSQFGFALLGDGSYKSNRNLLLKTVDGGETWTLQPINQNLTIYKILFVNESIGYALVSTGSSTYDLYKSTNGGRDFFSVPNATGFSSLQFKNGLLTGTKGAQIAFSSDQGFTWINVKRESSSAHIFNANRFVIGYSGGDSTYVRLTNDGGKTWQTANINLKRYDKIRDIQFLNDQKGYLIGGYTTDGSSDLEHSFSLAYQTEDGGLTWTPIQQPKGTQGEAYEIGIKKNKIYILYRPHGILPASKLGTIHMSEDAGKTWQAINNIHGNKDYIIESISYRSSKEGMAITRTAGTLGLNSQYFVYSTKDGGLTWLNTPVTDTVTAWFIRFISSNLGFLVGNNTILYTVDGSKSWQKVAIKQFPMTNPSYRKNWFDIPFKNEITHGCNIQFLSVNNWFALSDDNRLYSTIDQGQSWKLLNTPSLKNPMFYFLNQNVGYVTVENKALGDQLWITKNGGMSWSMVGPFRENSLFFLTEDIGFAGIKRTIDGGKHWLVQNDLVPPERVTEVTPNYKFLNSQVGYVGPTYYTFDAGVHWTKLNYLSEDVGTSTVFFESNSSLLSSDNYYGTMSRIVPANVPCNPLVISGDTTLFVENTTYSNYTATVSGWNPEIGLSWGISGGLKLTTNLTQATVFWANKGNTSYNITATAVNDCGESQSISLKVKTKIIVTALDPLAISHIKIYPNPAQSRVLIDIPDVKVLKSITWYDPSGKPLLLLGDPTYGYNVENLAPGIYIVRVQTELGTEVKRLIITK